MISLSDLLYKYADSTDMVYFYCGVLASIGFGAALPGFCLFFGDMIDSIGKSTASGGGDFESLRDSALTMVYFSLIVWGASTLQIWFMALYAERVAFKVKLHYFMKCIEKDAEYYDMNNPTEMASRISKETAAI